MQTVHFFLTLPFEYVNVWLFPGLWDSNLEDFNGKDIKIFTIIIPTRVSWILSILELNLKVKNHQTEMVFFIFCGFFV